MAHPNSGSSASMASPQPKGLILAAGLGSRLRPITSNVPKPLVPFAGTTPLALSLARLTRAGVQHAAINAHYLSHAVENFGHSGAGARLGLKSLKISLEPEILGTGGAFVPLQEWLGDDELIAINGDVVATFDLAELLSTHRRAGAVATMALLPEVIAGETPVWHDGSKVIAIGGRAPSAAKSGNFACAQVLGRRFLDLLPKSGSFDIISTGYREALRLGLPIAAMVHQGFWHDLRTPQFYWDALVQLLHGDDSLTADLELDRCRRAQGMTGEQSMGRWRAATARIAPTASLSGTVIIEQNVEIGASAVIDNCLLLPGARVSAGTTARHQMIGPDFQVTLLPGRG